MKKKILSILLSVCMVLTMLPVSAMAADTSIDTSGEITAFAPLTETEKSVSTGTSNKDLALPQSLTATVRTAVTADSGALEEPVQDSGNSESGGPTAPEWKETTADIPVTWTSEPEYDMDTEGDYVFTPVIEGYTVSVDLPEITVTVGAAMLAMLRGAVSTPTALDYAVDAVSNTDYELDTANKTLIIKTDKGAAFWSASGTAYLSYTIKLAKSIDVSAFQWTPVGGSSSHFIGTFDGQGHSITGLTVKTFTSDSAGVFGCVGNYRVPSSATVKNLTVEGSVDLTSAGERYAGGIAGTNYGTIENCANSTDIKLDVSGGASKSNTGGIAGSNYGIVQNCANSGEISAISSYEATSGGIAGDSNAFYDSGSITNCYNTGSVSASGGSDSNLAGGIAGGISNGASVTYCYYSDSATITGTNSHIGTSLTDTAMKAASGTAGALIDRLNSWVNTKASTDYNTWQADSENANGGYPVFGAAWATAPSTTFDFCNGTAPASVKPDSDPTWGETGYTFAGWYTAPNGGGTELTGAGDSGTYYAKWTAGSGENLRTVCTTALDLTDIGESKLYGSTKDGDIYTNTDEGWTWYAAQTIIGSKTYAANILVLSGLTLNTTDATALKVPDSTTIVLSEDTTSTIKGGNAESDSEEVCTYGIYGVGALTINGSGTLNVTAGNASYTGSGDAKNSCSKGIYNDGALTIADTGKVTAAAGAVDFGTANDFEDTQSVGIGCSGALTVNGGTVTGIGGQAFMSFGIGGSGNLTINSGTVIGTGGTSIACYGISSDGDLRINGGTVTGTGDISLVSHGIYGKGTIAITGGTVFAISSKEASISAAIESATSLTIGSGEKPATIANATDGTTAITTSSGTVASQELVMSGSDAVSISFPDICFTISGTHTLPGAAVGYSDQTPLTITVSNTGNQATGVLNVGISGENSNSFTLSERSLSSIAVSGSDSFTIKPKNGLSAGTYTATITVIGNNDITDSFTISFTVSVASPTNDKGGSGRVSSTTENTDKTETKVDTKGNTATVTTKPDSISTNGDTASIETTILSVTVDNTPTSTNGSMVDTAQKAAVTINVPTAAIVQQLAAKKNVDLTITVPSAVAKDAVGNAVVTINANKEILEAAKDNLTDVTIKIKDADTQQLAYSWTFKGEDLAKSTVPVNDVNIAMSVHLTTEVPKVNVITPTNKGLVLSFDHSGLLPSVASVKFSALERGFKPGQTLYFYYYNPTTRQIESLGNDAYTVDGDGNVTVQISHCSDYVLLPKSVRTITLDTRTYTMSPKKSYEIGVKLTGISNTVIEAYSSTKGVANVAVLKNGNVKATGLKPGLTYIMIDVYDSKNKFLTHASIRLTVQNGVKENGNSARQYGIF